MIKASYQAKTAGNPLLCKKQKDKESLAFIFPATK